MPQIGDTEIFEVAYYDADNALIVPDPVPKITIISPTGTTLVNAVNMTQLGSSAVFKYEYTYAANGSHKWYTTTTDTDASPASTPMLSIVVTDPPDVNVARINDSSTAAAQLARSAATIVNGAAVSGTLSTTQMSTDLTEGTDNHFNGRIIIWTSGVLVNQATDITDYDGATKTLTFTQVTEAPQAADTFVIL